jgi:hypothetical protein
LGGRKLLASDIYTTNKSCNIKFVKWQYL